MGFPWKVDAPESFSLLITLAHGRKMGKEIRASQSCSVVCSFGELNPFKPNSKSNARSKEQIADFTY